MASHEYPLGQLAGQIGAQVPPPHASTSPQLPQASVPPQPSIKGPQVKCSPTQVFGTQAPSPQTLGWPKAPQVLPPVQVPQLKSAEQPSETSPQFLPRPSQVLATQLPTAQTFAVPPPPQDWPSRQLPHCSCPPHPSGIVPQVAWESLHVVAVVQTPPSTCDAGTQSGLVASSQLPVAVQQPWHVDASQTTGWAPQAVSTANSKNIDKARM